MSTITYQDVLASMQKFQRELASFPDTIPFRVYETIHATQKTDMPVKLMQRRQWMSDGYFRRVQKKWVKRFGYQMKPAIFKTPDAIYVHPSLAAQVRRTLSRMVP